MSVIIKSVFCFSFTTLSFNVVTLIEMMANMETANF